MREYPQPSHFELEALEPRILLNSGGLAPGAGVPLAGGLAQLPAAQQMEIHPAYPAVAVEAFAYQSEAKGGDLFGGMQGALGGLGSETTSANTTGSASPAQAAPGSIPADPNSGTEVESATQATAAKESLVSASGAASVEAAKPILAGPGLPASNTSTEQLVTTLRAANGPPYSVVGDQTVSPYSGNQGGSSPTSQGGDWGRPVALERAAAKTQTPKTSNGPPDLTTYINNLLASQSSSFTVTNQFSSVSVGGMLELDGVQLGVTASLSGGVWSGTVTIAATGGALFPANSLSASITPSTPGGNAVSGTYTFSGSGTPTGTYSLNLVKLTMTVGDAVTVSAGNVNVTYDPKGAGNQTLASISTATASANTADLSGFTSASLSNLNLRSDGFSFSGVSLTAASASIHNLFTGPATLTFSDFNVSYGYGTTGPSLSGTMAIDLSSAAPSLPAASVSFDFSNFAGAGPTGQFGVTIGGILELQGVQLTTSGTGTTISAASAVVFPGHTFTGQIASSTSAPAITGSLSGGSYSFSLGSAAALTLTVGEAVQVTATGVTLSYNPNAAGSQTLATIAKATATSADFANLGSATLTNFVLRSDGFSFDGFTIGPVGSSASPLVLGNDVIKATSATLAVTNFNVNFGNGGTPASVTGTVSLNLSGVTLFPDNGLVTFGPTTVTASYSFTNFNGTSPSGQLSLDIQNFSLAMGSALQLQAGEVVIKPGATGNVPMATVSAVTLSSPLFSGMGTISVTNLAIYQTGFTLGSAVWGPTGTVTIGQFFQAGSLTVTLGKVALMYNGLSSRVAGNITVSVKAGVLFPTVPFLNVQLGDFTGLFSMGLNAPSLSFQFPSLNISIGEAFTLNLGAISFNPTLPGLPGLPNLDIIEAPDVRVTLPKLFSVPNFSSIDLGAINFHTWGFTLPAFNVDVPTLSIGNFISIGNLNLNVSGFNVDLRATPIFSGSLNLTLGSFALFPNTHLFHFGFTNLLGSFDLTGLGKLSLNFGSIDMSFSNLVGIQALNVTLTPDLPTLGTIPFGTISFPALGGLPPIKFSGLSIFQVGFTLADLSVSFSQSLTLGGILSLPSPSLNLTNLAFIDGVSLTGIITITSLSPSLSLGQAIAATADQITATYNLFTGQFTGALTNFNLNIGGLANLSAANAAVSYTPASGGPSKWLIGATGLQAFVGTATGSSQVGMQLTGGSLALAVFNSAGATTYALDATGAVSLVGLPSGTLSVSAGNVELRSDTAGALSTAVTVNGSPVYLNFTGNTQTIFAKGLTLRVGTFASIAGDFGFSELTLGGQNYIAIGATKVNVSSGTGSVSVGAAGASLALLIQPGSGGSPATFALVANGGTASLSGVPGLTFTSSGLSVKVRNGLDPSTITGLSSQAVATPGGSVSLNFGVLGSGTGNLTDIEGTLTLTISNFVSITGVLGFQQFTDSSGSTFLAVGGRGLTIVLGTPTTNLTVANATLGLVIAPASAGSPAKYALQATGSSSPSDTSLNGVPGVTLTGTNVLVRMRQGLDVSGDTSVPTSLQTPNGPVTLNFSGLGSGTSTITDIEGTLNLSVGSFATISGNFGLQSFIDAVGQTDLAIGATGANVSVGASSSAAALTLTGATLSMLVRLGSGANPTTYALEAAAASASLPSIAGITVSGGNLLVLARSGLDLATVGALPAALHTTGGDVSSNFIGMPKGSSNLTQVETSLTLSVGNFISLTGSFGIVNTTIGSTSFTEIGGTGITINVPAGSGGLTLANTTVAAIIQQGAGGGYAVEVTGSTNPSDASLVGVPGLSVTASNVVVLAKGGLDVATLPADLPVSIPTPNGNVALKLSGFTPGTDSVAEVQGQFALSVAGFVTVQGNFGIETFADGTGTDLAIGAQNVSAVLGNSDVNVTVAGASLALVLKPGTGYDLMVQGGTDSLNGVPDLTLSASGLTAKVRKGLDPTSLANLPSSIPVGSGSVSLNFSGLGSSDVTEIDGSVTIGVANFVNLSGNISFTERTSGTVTTILVGGSNVNAFVGSSDRSLGAQITGASVGLAVYRDSANSASTYALQASTPNITAIGLPSDITLSGAVSLGINTTGGAVNETLPGGQTISFSAAQGNVSSFGGTLTLGIASVAKFTGTFSFGSATSGTVSKLLVGVSNLATASGSSIAQTSGPGTFSLSGGIMGLVFYENGATHSAYALSATATATVVTGPALSGAATLTFRRNTTTSAQNDLVTVGTQTVPVIFAANEVATGTPLQPFQSIAVSNASLSIDNTILISARTGTSSSPTPGARSTALTSVTLTLQNPANSEVLFTISAGTAVYTTFSRTVTAAAATSAGLAARADGGSWAAGDKDLVLTNVSFSLGGFVGFTAQSIDLQHYTAGTGTVDSFSFTGATITFYSGTQAMVSLSGSPRFHYNTTDGFKLDSFTNPGFGFLGQSVGGVGAIGGAAGTQSGGSAGGGSAGGGSAASGSSHTLGPLTLTTPSVSLGNFGFAFGPGTTANLSATVTITVASATIGASSSVVHASLTNLSGSFVVTLGFNLANLKAAPTVTANGFTLTAQSASIVIGQYLTLTATQVRINPTATATQDLVLFGSLTATLSIRGLQLTGGASNFAIEGDGSFLAKPGFAVLLGFDASKAGSVGLPSWLPLQSASVTLVWADFNGNPSNFVIELSATINFKLQGLVLVQGSVTNLVIDPNLLAAGQFPVTSVGSVGVGVSGNLYAGQVSGQLILGVVRFDANGNVVDGLGFLQGTTTPGAGPFTSAFYGGIEGGFTTAAGIGFTIRIGLSEFGPLQIYLEIGAPVPIFPGIFLTNFRGGVTFDAAFPTVNITGNASDALQLRQPAFNTPDSLTVAQWEAQLQQQVANQYHSGATPGSGWSHFSNGPMIIQAGMTLYVGSPDAFRVDGDIIFDTRGRILIIGTATFGDTESIGVKLYCDTTQASPSNPIPPFLFLMEEPSQNSPNPPSPPVYSIYGETTFSYANGVFSINIVGAGDFSEMGGLFVAHVQGALSLSFSANSFNITLSNCSFSDPTIASTSLGTVSGTVTVEHDGGSIGIWGAVQLTLAQSGGAPYLPGVSSLGINLGANYQAYLTFNTTGEVKQALGLTLEPDSFSLLFNGTADFQVLGADVFQLNGAFAMEIGIGSLSVFFQGQMFLGPPNATILTFNANGLIFLETQPTARIPVGFAAKMTLTEGGGISLPNGLSFGENWLLVLNTTGADITYQIPAPAPVSPPGPTIPTVLGPDYSSGNPLALRSYETTINGQRALEIPSGPPAGGLSSYVTWTPASPNTPYLIVLGRGSLTIAGAFTLVGDLNITGSVSGGRFNFILDADADMALQVNGTTVFDFQVSGGLQLSNHGIAGALAIRLSNDLPSTLGFTLQNPSFLLEVNTTANPVTINSITVPTGPNNLFAEVHITGDLIILGGVLDLSGEFDLSITGGNLVMAIDANTSILGIKFFVEGFAGIYYDGSPGIALSITLGVGSGGIGNNYTINLVPGVLTMSGSFTLNINTTSITRSAPTTGTTSSFDAASSGSTASSGSGGSGSGLFSGFPGVFGTLLGNLFGSGGSGSGPGSSSVAPGFSLGVNNLSVNILNIFNVGGSANITLSKQGVGISFDLGLDLIGLHFGLSGYFYSWTGAWGLTATVSASFGDDFAGAGGSLTITISSSGFSLTLYGYVVFLDIRTSITLGFTIHTDTGEIDVDTSLGSFKVGTYSGTPLSTTPVTPTPTPPTPAPPTLDAAITNVGGTLTLGGSENYVLARESGDPGSTSGETILVTDKSSGVQEAFTNVRGITASGTLRNATINLADKGIAVPVSFTLDSGNTIDTGGASVSLYLSGSGNRISTADGANVTIQSSGANTLTTGANAVVFISGSGSNTVTTGANSVITITGGGYDSFTGSGGNDLYYLNLANNTGASISITDSFGSNNTVNVTGPVAKGYTDTISVTDTNGTNNTVNINGPLTDPPPIYVTASQVREGTNTVNYSGLSSLNLVMTGTPGITYYVQSTNAGTYTTIQTGGASLVDIGSTAGVTPASAGVIRGIQGPLAILGGATNLLIDNTGATTAQSGTLTPTTFNGFGMGSGGIIYQSISLLTINLGSGGNTLTINDITPSTHTIVDGGRSSNDTVSLTFAGDFNGAIDFTSFEHGTITLPGNFNGVLNDTNPGHLELAQIGGSLTSAATLNVGSIDRIHVAGDLSGTLNAAGAISYLTVVGVVSGSVTETGLMSAVSIGSLSSGGRFTAVNPADASQYSANALADIGRMTVAGNLDGRLVVSGNVGSFTVEAYLTGTVAVQGALNYLRVTNDVSGSVTESGAINLLTIGGSLTSSGSITAQNTNDSTQYLAAGQVAIANIVTMIVTHNLMGLVIVTGNVGTLTVGSGAPDVLSGLLAVQGALTTLAVAGDLTGAVTETGTIKLLTISGSLGPPGTHLIQGRSTPTGLISAWNTNLALGNIVSFTIGNNLSGVVLVSGNLHSLTVNSSGVTPSGIPAGVTATGVITAGSLDSVNVGPDGLNVGDNMAGTITVVGTLGSLRVAGGTPGVIVAGRVGTLAVYGGFGPIVLNVTESGIQRLIDATPLSNEYPAPYPATADPYAVPTMSTPYVNLQYFYEGTATGLANPQAAIRVTNNVSAAPAQFDLSVIVYSDAAKFNLARLDANGVSGIGNVVVEGDLLTSVTAQALGFFSPTTLPQPPLPEDSDRREGSVYPLPAGIILPNDNLVGVSIRDFAPAGHIEAHTIQGVAFGATVGEDGRVETGAQADEDQAAALVAPGTAWVQANGTFRVAFGDRYPVGWFMMSRHEDQELDDPSVVFTDQAPNDTRGAVTALVTVTMPTLPSGNDHSHDDRPDSVIQSIALRGDGGAIRTQATVAQAITSTGPLGDVFLHEKDQAPVNITAPSIIGTIDLGEGIVGTIQTTGQRMDPITGITSSIPADWGRVYSVPVEDDHRGDDGQHPRGSSTRLVTTAVHSEGGLSGRLICRGNLISQVISDGGISGVVAVQGDLGVKSGATRLGGIEANGQTSGQVVVLGNVWGEVRLEGGLKSGRVAVEGSVFGNLRIDGGVDRGSAIVARGEIGDVGLKTYLNLENLQGILAVEGSVNFAEAPNTRNALFFQVNIPASSPNAATINALFTNGGQPLLFDLTANLDLQGLNLILTKLSQLTVGANGTLN